MKSSYGGMQSAGLRHSIYCEKCGKPAARVVRQAGNWYYMHYTKKGIVWHSPAIPRFVRKMPGYEKDGGKT